MKRLIVIFIVGVMLLTGCTPAGKGDKMIIPDGYTKVSLKEVSEVTVDGVGAELDPHYFSQNVTRNVSGLDESGFEIITERIRKMGLKKLRIMLLPQWLEPNNDNTDSSVIDWSKLTPESLEMRSLYKILDVAQEIGAEVTLALWGVSRQATLHAEGFVSRPYFMAQNNSSTNWVVGAKGDMVDEWCENFSAYVQQLVVNKGYTCITEITPGNEPDWSYQIDSELGDLNAYIDMCKKLDKRFRDDGIRDKVKFNLVDSTDTRSEQWLSACAEELQGIAEVMNSHTYIFGYETPNSTVRQWENTNVLLSRSAGVPHFVGEFGSNQVVGSTRTKDIDEYRRGVLMVRLLSNFFNAGASGASYWSLFDQYNNARAGYNEMMQTGLWRSAKAEYASEPYYRSLKEDFECRPQYYAYSLMTKFIEKGAQIRALDIDEEFVSGTAFYKDGRHVIIMANNDEFDKNYSIVGVTGEYDVYRYIEGALPATDDLIQSTEKISIQNLALNIQLKSNTVVVLVEKQ